jgi:hypothetical protein
MANVGLQSPVDGVITTDLLRTIDDALHTTLYNGTRVTSSQSRSDTIGSHAVKLVGWGSNGATQYWEIQNSWGSSWNGNGFFRLEAGVDLLSVESLCPTAASYAATADVLGRRVSRSQVPESIMGRKTTPGAVAIKTHAHAIKHASTLGGLSSIATDHTDVTMVVAAYKSYIGMSSASRVSILSAESQATYPKKYVIEVQHATTQSRRAAATTETHSIIAHVSNHPAQKTSLLAVDGKRIVEKSGSDTNNDSSMSWMFILCGVGAGVVVTLAVALLARHVMNKQAHDIGCSFYEPEEISTEVVVTKNELAQYGTSTPMPMVETKAEESSPFDAAQPTEGKARSNSDTAIIEI